MSLIFICSAVLLAACFTMNILLLRRPDDKKRLKIAFAADTVYFLIGISGAAVTYIKANGVFSGTEAGLLSDSFRLFATYVLIFAAAVTAVYVICTLLSPRLFPLQLGFYFAASLLTLIFTAVFSLLTRSDTGFLYRYIGYFGAFTVFALGISPAITVLRLLLSPELVKSMTELKTDKKSGRIKKKELKKY